MLLSKAKQSKAKAVIWSETSQRGVPSQHYVFPLKKSAFYVDLKQKGMNDSDREHVKKKKINLRDFLAFTTCYFKKRKCK